MTASGIANTFEAALTVEMLTESGDILCVRNIMTTPGSSTPGSWQTDVAFVPPDSDEPATLRAYELSAQDGTPINVVERDVTVTSERPPIIIVTPVCGDTAAPGGQIAVTGRALVFEAQFSIDLRDAAGDVLLTQAVTAESGTEESDFTATVTLPTDLAGGYYDIVAYDNNAKDGSIEYEFPVQILVQ
ncbi:Gmad2 immunoglobulin-like domain-containing protein [Cryobacterium sp. SO2]|uniref:Gmad2 immunoglobulin-like domain-containing protein n=1 Tax=Cryobacterium sp. SO2 TaxID=1897060 RepID=UPI00223DCD68|nr:Gmad2 immunoglobulin-like domain-containing protein [Cryobacterium sp. SO2]WEO77432.1 Gmad2 immunoglobulin-like domain-containing protein [Cryobacterium sp. SO2]